MKAWPQFASAVLAIAGASAMWWFIASREFLPLAWNISPYLLCLALAFITRWRFAVLIGVLLMATVDAWLMLSSVLGINTEYLLAGSLLSTLKVMLVLPLGLAGGAAIDRRVAL